MWTGLAEYQKWFIDILNRLNAERQASDVLPSQPDSDFCLHTHEGLIINIRQIVKTFLPLKGAKTLSGICVEMDQAVSRAQMQD